MKMKKSCTECTRSKHRTEEEKKKLTRRLNIISGQINGIQQMIDDDRYCDDVLIQIASATNALKSLSNEILKSHMTSCMVEDIKNDKLEVIDDFDVFIYSLLLGGIVGNLIEKLKEQSQNNNYKISSTFLPLFLATCSIVCIDFNPSIVA